MYGSGHAKGICCQHLVLRMLTLFVLLKCYKEKERVAKLVREERAKK